MYIVAAIVAAAIMFDALAFGDYPTLVVFC